MAQTIEGFVGKALDEARISPLHVKIVALIAAGYFFDVIDFTILGSLNPFLTKSFATPAEFGLIGSAGVVREAARLHVREQRALDDVVDDVEEISRRDQRDDLLVER